MFVESIINQFNILIATSVTILPSYAVSLTLLFALVLDAVLGEAKKYHYLVGFGFIAQCLETKMNKNAKAASLAAVKSGTVKSGTVKSGTVKLSTAPPSTRSLKVVLSGAVSWALMVLPLPLLYYYFFNEQVFKLLDWYWQVVIDGTVLYLALGLNSLNQHAMQVYRPLKSKDLSTARHFTGYLVSRETSRLSADEMSRATIESMLENGHDSVISSLFYFLIGGAPLVILHRFANTLDAMWGYKNSRYNAFGYASARLDDALGFITGKVCTLLYAVQGPVILCLKNAYQQGKRYKSHNGGWVMAAGATVLNIKLGGAAIYHGSQVQSVTLGKGDKATMEDIPRSISVVRRSAYLLLIITAVVQTIQIF